MTETADGTGTASGPTATLGFDPYDPDFLADPYRHYRRLAEAGPATRGEGGPLVVTSNRACAAVLRDPRFGRGGDAAVMRDEDRTVNRSRRSFLVMDPPDHTRLRGLVGKAFTPRMVERLRPRVADLVDELLDAAMEKGEVDLVEALAYPLPVTVISELLGVPAGDWPRFRGWVDDLAAGLDPDFLQPPERIRRRERSRAEFCAYLLDLFARRRADPGDDLISALLAVEESGDALSEDELLSTCVLLIVAGHETTISLIGNAVLALLRHPAELAALREGAVTVGTALDELLRYDAPVQSTVRVALEPADVGGTAVAEGELVMLMLGAANRDPAVFADPDRLDLGRDARRHLAFGLGIHFCLGAPLARLEAEAALKRLAGRAPALALATGPDGLRYKDRLVLRGLAELPVRLR
ncbi:cytochrome P450 [Actinomadura fibrosa]|uniref:Cytochrome P450 n=1 Tax=Actinomadura fibrosa TaxID=111802 RepID=A0ABW2XVQ5_9ACTN|nr:cytochrome P450 [Actinomadura fibrosa]